MVLIFLTFLIYTASVILYYSQYWSLFRRPNNDPPYRWNLGPITPLLTACFTPVALILSRNKDDSSREILLVILGAMIFAIFILVLILLTKSYYSMFDHVGLGKWEFTHLTWARVTLVVGELVLLACAFASIWVASTSVKTTASSP